jgi:hypothetical protein
MTRLRLRRQQCVAWLVLMLAGIGAAHAELRNCDLEANPGDYKVVLDDLAFASAAAQADSKLVGLREALQFSFDTELIKLRAAAAKMHRDMKVPMRLVFCAGRQPSLDGSDFTPARAERLSDERVVVEMWGRLDLSATAGGTPARIARIGYVMPPVQHYIDEEDAPPLHLFAYPKAGAAGSIADLENLSELQAFALVGLGTKAFRAKHYDLASWAFNEAEQGITNATVGGANPRLQALFVYVKRARCESQSSARKDHDYVGSLWLVEDKDCNGVEP